jgi:hypothetical protein
MSDLDLDAAARGAQLVICDRCGDVARWRDTLDGLCLSCRRDPVGAGATMTDDRMGAG